MDATVHRMDDHRESDSRAETTHGSARTNHPSQSPSQARRVRARLNGLPCLVSVTEDSVLSGQVAVTPVAGAKVPLPPKGRRAMLELVTTPDEAVGQDPIEPIEITVADSHPRTGRFTARLLGLSEEQSQLLSHVVA
ncbi:hypothetical protein F1188_09785 [Roseospira marina]|uniref:PilZ domain-containing protein n=1 Tax=Roseospira marina TaxID=140057 RepID=A0A5M6IE77_9PROT|nr:hypothetical protein [Roseospira marina]KAA5605888.1 hypothetical protein F1188_09785 [Roseospira marina]MBB4313711.1 hypothetical protein [Roseospira marina]MBB5086873.1 hypothetical protein [Roseospira marina]